MNYSRLPNNTLSGFCALVVAPFPCPLIPADLRLSCSYLLGCQLPFLDSVYSAFRRQFTRNVIVEDCDRSQAARTNTPRLHKRDFVVRCPLPPPPFPLLPTPLPPP